VQVLSYPRVSIIQMNKLLLARWTSFGRIQ